MEGYDVVTFDDEKVGTVAGESGDYLIVEHGLIRKSKHALPRAVRACRRRGAAGADHGRQGDLLRLARARR